MIYLVESFYTFQGEGRYAGTPSVFIRFGGCNLRCEGFNTKTTLKNGAVLTGCDSIRAVDRKSFLSHWKKIEDENVLIKEIEQYLKKPNCKPDIVFTGGEPLLYHKEDIFCETIKYFISLEYRITIETNATINIDFEKYPCFKDVVFAMSVKLSNSKEPYEKRVNKEAISSILCNTKDSFFKFVLDKNIIDSKKAQKEIKDIIMKFNNSKVYCMPLGSSAEELKQHDKAVANFCIENCFCYMDRLHIRLWNNKEKV